MPGEPDPAFLRALLREINERVVELGWLDDGERIDFLCECGDPHCGERIEMTHAEFDEAKKRGPILAPGHSA